ncbi:MAG: acyltransferase family protein [Pseudomonadota bacterium]
MSPNPKHPRELASAGHLPHIDGLRAVSVLLVVAFHAWPDTLPGGFIGVDVFFVVSGFVITRMMIAQAESSGLSYREFLLKRVRRLWPNFALVCLVSFAFAWTALGPEALMEFARALIAAVGVSANWFFWATTDYFNEGLDTNLLLHAWSLSVEEQYYLVYPLLFLALWRRRLAFTAAVWAAWAASLSLSIASALIGSDDGVFFATHTRIWQLASGALLFLHQPSLGAADLAEWRRRLGFWLGFAAIIAAAIGLPADMRYPGFWALLPVLGACLCLHFGGGGAKRSTWLEGGRITYIGRISYSLYLWHWPTLVALSLLVHDPEDGHLLIAVAFSFSVAALAYHWVEQPVRQKRVLASDKTLVAAFIAVSAGLVGLAAWVLVVEGAPSRIPKTAMEALNIGPDPRAALKTCGPAQEISDKFLGDVDTVTAAPDDMILCVAGDTSRDRPDVVYWGDSHLAAISGALAERADSEGRFIIIAERGACPPLLGAAWSALAPAGAKACADWGEAVVGLVDAANPARTLLVGHWDTYAPRRTGLFGALQPGKLRAANPTATSYTPVAPRDLFDAALSRTADRLHASTKLEILLDVPTHDFSVPHAVSFQQKWPWLPGPAWLSKEVQLDRRAQYAPLMQTLDDIGRLTLHDPLDGFCPGESCLGEIDGIPLFFDGTHLSGPGADKLLLSAPGIGP